VNKLSTSEDNASTGLSGAHRGISFCVIFVQNRIMKRLLFLLLFIPVIGFGQAVVSPSTLTVGDYDRNLMARDTLFSQSYFAYRDTIIPVLDVTYHQFSSDSINWHKLWVTGDNYIRVSNNVKYNWKVLKILDLLDPLWKRDTHGGIYNTNVYDVHVMNSLEVEDSINTNNFYFLDGDSLRITKLNATDGVSGDILQNINGKAYWIPITQVFDSAGFYDAQNGNHEGIGVWNNTTDNVFYFRGIDVDSAFMAISLNNTDHTIVLAFDPTKLSVTAGIGLGGGGYFSSSGNVIVNMDIPELTTSTYDTLDWVPVYDVSAGGHRKVHINTSSGTADLDSVYWIVANDGDIDTVFNNHVLYVEEGDSLIDIKIGSDSVIVSLNGCPVPPGGLAGQVLVKLSNADCDFGWKNICDIIAPCDTVTVTAQMCDFANLYLADIVPTVGHLDIGDLSSTTATVGDYVIDWYVGGVFKFTTATSGAGITNYVLQPFTSAMPVVSGTYTPVIRWVYVNGEKYVSAYTQQGTYSPDLATCLSDVVSAAYICDNGSGYTEGAIAYEHSVSYSYELNTDELPTREISMDLDATTSYVPWFFYGENVIDTLRVYFVHGATETLLETWQVGTAYGAYNFPLHNIYSSYFNKITTLPTVATGDKIKFKIDPYSTNTNWRLSWKCLDTLDFDLCTPFEKDYQTIDTTAAITMVWNGSAGTYDLTYSNKSAHIQNDVQHYIFETSGWATNMTYVPTSNRWGNDFKISLNRNVNCAWLETPSSGYSCRTFTDSISYIKSSDTVKLVARNLTDYNLFKNSMLTVLASTKMTSYSSDPENVNHYKLLMFSASSNALCGDGTTVTYPKMYTHYDTTNVSYDDPNYTIQILLQKTVDGYTDSIANTCGTAPSTLDVPNTTAFYNLTDFNGTFKVGAWSLSDGSWTRTVLTQDSITAYVSYKGRYANYGGGMHEEVLDLCPTYDYVNLIASRHYFYPTYMRVVITLDDPGDPDVATQNFDVYNLLDTNGYYGAYRLVYRMVGGVGTWYSSGL